mgnify:FL=1|jgi:hypothetical protein
MDHRQRGDAQRFRDSYFKSKIEVWQKAEDTVTILEVGVTNDQQILSKFYALSDNFCQ